MAYRRGDGVEPYHSIDLEASPNTSNHDERVPLSPRVTPPPNFKVQDFPPSSTPYPPIMRPGLLGTDSERDFHKLSGVSASGPTHKSQNSTTNWGKGFDNFDSRNASEANFQYAEGDAPDTKVGKLYLYLLSSSIIARWFIFITPILALLWIPGILSLTAYPDKGVWSVRLLWWSIWLSVIWIGWWAALAFAMLLPHVLRHTLGLGAVSLRKYFEWLKRLQRPVAFFAWSVAVWASYNPLILARFTGDDLSPSKKDLSLIGRLTFGIMLCAIILFLEKFLIQFVAYKFHQRSYADRIARQKHQLQCLIVLYRNSSHLDRSDTLRDGDASNITLKPGRLFKKALHNVRRTAETTTSAFGNLATEIAGSSVLQPNSPAAMVSAALGSANKTRLLARRIFYSFRSEGSEHLILGDISRFFSDREMAAFAFEIFDKDENGDSTCGEMEAALLEIHTERLSLSASMKDVDSATSRLDNILMSIYSIIVLLIFAIMLNAQVTSIVTGAGALVLGLSWLIGGSAQEVLTSIVFLFIKHPFDIGDAIEIDTVSYTVKEIRLLSTVFVDARGCDVQCPNTVLNTKYIMNRRRSGPMSEPFEFACNFSTTFEQIEDLRARMLTFVKNERRDYFPIFDVLVQDIPTQASMTLKADIKYKSNWQQGALKAQRRNKWICALKNALAESKIFGPSGDPNAPAGTQQVTLVPYEAPAPAANVSPIAEVPRTEYNLTDPKEAMLSQGTRNVFGEEDEVPPQFAGADQQDRAVLRARRAAAEPGVGGRNDLGVEEIEMMPGNGQRSVGSARRS